MQMRDLYERVLAGQTPVCTWLTAFAAANHPRDGVRAKIIAVRGSADGAYFTFDYRPFEQHNRELNPEKTGTTEEFWFSLDDLASNYFDLAGPDHAWLTQEYRDDNPDHLDYVTWLEREVVTARQRLVEFSEMF